MPSFREYIEGNFETDLNNFPPDINVEDLIIDRDINSPLVFGYDKPTKIIQLKGKITPENCEKFFPKKWGVEMEFECREEIGRSWLQKKLKKEGLICDVIPDGSLSEYGFEVVSKPFDDILELKEFMNKVLELFREWNLPIEDTDNAAIHIHTSNTKNPINIFLLASYFETVFELIRKRYNNGLTHYLLFVPDLNSIKSSMGNWKDNPYDNFNNDGLNRYYKFGFNPYYTNILDRVYPLFMDARRTTVRYSGYDTELKTMEFRVFPQKFDPELYNIYLKIVGGIIQYAENHTLEEVHDMVFNNRVGFYDKGRIPFRADEFAKLVGLNKQEVYRLFNPFKTHNTDLSNKTRWELFGITPPTTKIIDHQNYIFKNNFSDKITIEPVIKKVVNGWQTLTYNTAQCNYRVTRDGGFLIDGFSVENPQDISGFERELDRLADQVREL